MTLLQGFSPDLLRCDPAQLPSERQLSRELTVKSASWTLWDAAGLGPLFLLEEERVHVAWHVLARGAPPSSLLKFIEGPTALEHQSVFCFGAPSLKLKCRGPAVPSEIWSLQWGPGSAH